MSTIKSSTTSTTAYSVVADTTGTLVFQTGATPTTAMTLGTDQSVTMAGRTTNPTTISVGAATPSTSGAGITFPATQSASSDANTLDDYEEGTWTPVDASGAGITFTTATGYYTRIGQVVTGSFRVTYASGSVSAAQAAIGGLPFTVKNTDTNNCFVGCYSNATTMISGETGQNTNAIYFYTMGTFTASPNTNLTGKTHRGVFSYIV